MQDLIIWYTQVFMRHAGNARLAHHGLQCKKKGLPLSHPQSLHAKAWHNNLLVPMQSFMQLVTQH